MKPRKTQKAADSDGQVMDGSSRGVNTATASVPVSELNQNKEWEKYPNRFRHLYEKLLPENLRRHCREWPTGKADSEIKQLIQENSKPQDLIVYSDGSVEVTNDQSGWGFTVNPLTSRTNCNF